MSLGELIKSFVKDIAELLDILLEILLDIVPDELPELDWLLVLSVALLLLFIACVTTSKVKKPKSEGDLATIVKIVGKSEDKKDTPTTKYSECVVTFQFENKKEVELKVPPDAHDFIKTGDKGRLYYEGDKFKKFIR